jgi:hypothetical protein
MKNHFENLGMLVLVAYSLPLATIHLKVLLLAR